MNPDIESWPPPNDATAFESLCLDLCKEIWGAGSGAQKNGRSGQPQAGVDVFGQHQGEWVGVQCKQKDGLLRKKLTSRELNEEVLAARHFKPLLATFILATTAPRDASLQQRARELTQEHERHGLFKVEVWSWHELWPELYRRQELLKQIAPTYWPALFSARDADRRATSTSDCAPAVASLLSLGHKLQTFCEGRRLFDSTEGARQVFDAQNALFDLVEQRARSLAAHPSRIILNQRRAELQCFPNNMMQLIVEARGNLTLLVEGTRPHNNSAERSNCAVRILQHNRDWSGTDCKATLLEEHVFTPEFTGSAGVAWKDRRGALHSPEQLHNFTFEQFHAHIERWVQRATSG